MKKRFLLLPVAAFLALSFVFYEANPFDKMFENLELYSSKFYPEKVYLHTDRTVYAKEDTVWIKTYLVNGINHSPQTESRVVYIDLVSPTKTIVNTQLAYVQNIGSANDIIIDRNWPAGKYMIRAYTKQDVQSDVKYIFSKEIEILDINEEYKIYEAEFGNELASKQAATINPKLRFFPEGGQLIASLKNRIALKLEGVSAEAATGYVEDSAGNKISDFKLYKFGYGSVNLTPELEETYKAVVILNGREFSFDLPVASSEGYVMFVNNRPESIVIDINASKNDDLEGGLLIGHTRGSVFLEQRIQNLEGKTFTIKIPTKDLNSGITHFTFFNKDGQPECERLVFIDNNKLDLAFSSDKDQYTKREKVSLKINPESEITSDYDCSVAVVELNNVNIKDNKPNIKTWLLLDSDLRGKIDNASYFFEKEGDRKRSYLLDLVMMTNGWRRFTWKDMQTSDPYKDVTLVRERGLFIKGKTTKKLFSKSGVKSSCILTFMDQNFTEEELTTGEDGMFAFGPYTSFDTLDAILQARKFKDGKEKLDGNRNLSIQLFENNAKPDIYWGKIGEVYSDQEAFKNFVVNNKTAQQLKDQYHIMSVELDDIVIKAKRKKEIDDISDTQRRLSAYMEPTARKTFEEGENFRYVDVYQMLETMPGVRVTGGPGSRSINLGRGVTSFNASTEPLYLLNGREVTTLEDILPIEVHFIDVLKGANASIYGSRAANGVVAIYTDGRRTAITERKDGIINLKLNGFYPGREFYSPDYSGKVSKVFTPDMRSTLYWNPIVNLSNENSPLEFYTGDIQGEFMAIIEGVNQEGKILRKTQIFEVR